MRKKEDDLKMLGDVNTQQRSEGAKAGGFSFPDYTPPQYTAPQYTAPSYTAPEKFQMPQYAAPNPYQGKNYVNPYTGQVESLFQQISSRQPFTYDVNADALYQQMKDQYIQGGNMAMLDTMGQAQAMTGGYGNSYAQTAGQQQFNQYMQGLNDQVPELYNLALQRYIQEGQDLKDIYSMASGQEAQLYDRFMAEDARDYGRWKDAADTGYRQWLDQVNLGYAQYQDDRNFGYNQYQNDRNFGYNQYQDDRNFGYQQNQDQANLGLDLWLNQQDIAREDYLANRELALNQAQMMMEMGVRPSDDLIAASGLSQEYVNMFFPEDSGGNTGGWSALGDAINEYWRLKNLGEDTDTFKGIFNQSKELWQNSDATLEEIVTGINMSTLSWSDKQKLINIFMTNDQSGRRGK